MVEIINSTTRFRRYDGDEAGITDPKVRPAILKEYTDTGHLLKANHWYHIKITNENNRVSYYIDGKRLVDSGMLNRYGKAGLVFVPLYRVLVLQTSVMNVHRTNGYCSFALDWQYS